MGLRSWHYDTLSSPQLLQAEDYGPDGAVGGWAPPPLPPGAHDHFGDYGWTEQRADNAGVIPRQAESQRMTRPCDHSGAGRRISPMHGTQSLLHVAAAEARAGYGLLVVQCAHLNRLCASSLLRVSTSLDLPKIVNIIIQKLDTVFWSQQAVTLVTH